MCKHSLKRRIMLADENIGSVWNDEETLKFLKLIHETNIIAVFPPCFVHGLPPFEV